VLSSDKFYGNIIFSKMLKVVTPTSVKFFYLAHAQILSQNVCRGAVITTYQVMAPYTFTEIEISGLGLFRHIAIIGILHIWFILL
jgi:hypothetical protein